MPSSLRMPCSERNLAGRRRPREAVPQLEGNLQMKLGLNVGYWGLGITPEQQLEMVTTAEEAGYDSVWRAEAHGSDAAPVLRWLAAKTSRIRIGSGIFPMPARAPAVPRLTAATLEHPS